jgi:hypothetical protein
MSEGAFAVLILVLVFGGIAGLMLVAFVISQLAG